MVKLRGEGGAKPEFWLRHQNVMWCVLTAIEKFMLVLYNLKLDILDTLVIGCVQR